MSLRQPLVSALNGADDLALRQALEQSLANAPALNHGHMSKWQAAIAALEQAACSQSLTDADQLAFLANTSSDPDAVRAALETLIPWRKGPFKVADIAIDSEWRCDLKWGRLRPWLDDLNGRRVLDVGSGNGYFSIRTALGGARAVIGIDPTALYVMQFRALAALGLDLPVDVLPLTMEALQTAAAFDTVMSMGVLYHRRSPLDHLRECRDALRPGGQFILETLVVPGGVDTVLTPPDRYARMRNVWFVPSAEATVRWLQRVGFEAVELCDVTPTTTGEQRPTEWMPYESLTHALNPADPALTIEGWAAPCRAIIRARR